MTMPYGLLPMLASDQQMTQNMSQLPAANPMAGAGMGAPPAGPQAGPPAQPRLIDRLREGTHGLLGDLRKRLAPTPQGFEGLLSPDQIESARPTILQSLIGAPDSGSSRDIYRNNMTQMVEGQQAAQAMQRQRAMLAARDEIGRRFTAPAPNAPHADQMAYLKTLYGAYAAIGDTEMMGKVGEVLKSIGGEGTQASLQRTEALDAEGKPIWEFSHPTTGAVVRTTPREKDETRATGLTPAQETSERFRMWDMSDRLSREFNQETDRHQVRAEAYSTLKGVEEQAQLGNAAAQMSMIFSFMRLLDPNSAVREGEYHKAEMLQGIPEQVRNIFNKLRQGQFLGTGGGLTPDDWTAINRFLLSANGLVRSSMRDFDNLVNDYSGRATERGLNPKGVVKDYFRQYRSTLAGEAAPAPTHRIAAPPKKP